ncbi:MAG: hypothetical protein EOO65_01550 [Methanosarcinales archaeon]|nr:MAG: hypothetical protein EOO65_01550 [Methanosarcinales archaeon]
MVRTLREVKDHFDRSGVGVDSGKVVEKTQRERMAADCKGWIGDLKATHNIQIAIDSIAAFIRGEGNLCALKPMYDAGLVACDTFGQNVVPTSSVAASVLHSELASALKGALKPLRDIMRADLRGNELERQVRTCLDGCHTFVPAHMLSGDSIPALLHIQADYALPFSTAEETMPWDGSAVLYLPTSTNYAADAIVVPRAALKDEPILVVECSTTDPRDADRVSKVLTWFDHFGLIQQLWKVHPHRSIVCLLMYDGALTMKSIRGAKFSELDNSARETSRPRARGETSVLPTVEVQVVDMSGLQRIGVNV